MKFLLVVSMLISSAFANANDWDVKCYEKGPRGLDLTYKIRVSRDAAINQSYQLLDCHLLDDASMESECRDRGYLRRIEEQNQNCLVSAVINADPFSLCHENQETFVEESRLVPVRITDDHQNHRAYCDRSILRILYK